MLDSYTLLYMLYKMLLYVALISCLMVYVDCEEPESCSQFHYVDKLLDKMIRMEVKVEGFDKGITETNTEIKSTLEELLELKKQMKDDIEDTKREQQEFRSEFLELKTQISNASETMKSENEEFQTKQKKQMKNSVEIMKESLVIPNVVFKARTVVGTSVSAGQTIILTENMLNYGDGYDNNTGIFTVPISGTYLFTFHLCVVYKQNLYYGLVYDNIIHTSGRFYDSDATQCYTADGMIPLTAGQKVWIKCLHSSGTLYESSSSTHNYWNTFSGMLIHK